MVLFFDLVVYIGSCFYHAIFWLCEFIECQIDIQYLGWLFSKLYPALLVLFILPFTVLFLLYLSALLLYIHSWRWSRVREVLHESLTDPWVGGRYFISVLWDIHGYIWYGYDVEGADNVPRDKGALIVYYHGAIPIDVYYLVAHFVTKTGKHIHCVGDRFLQKIPGWQSILEAFQVTPGTVADCVRKVSSGHLLAIGPGGVREAQFSDHSYTLLWGHRRGYAKVALQANCPIVPMFTRNLREAFRVLTFPSFLFEALYSRFKLPFAPLYGGFPVKMVTHLGPCIYPLPGETADELANRVEVAVYGLIAKHQRLPGSILSALLDRLHPKLGKMLLGNGKGVAWKRRAEENAKKESEGKKLQLDAAEISSKTSSLAEGSLEYSLLSEIPSETVNEKSSSEACLLESSAIYTTSVSDAREESLSNVQTSEEFKEIADDQQTLSEDADLYSKLRQTQSDDNALKEICALNTPFVTATSDTKHTDRQNASENTDNEEKDEALTLQIRDHSRQSDNFGKLAHEKRPPEAGEEAVVRRRFTGSPSDDRLAVEVQPNDAGINLISQSLQEPRRIISSVGNELTSCKEESFPSLVPTSEKHPTMDHNTIDHNKKERWPCATEELASSSPVVVAIQEAMAPVTSVQVTVSPVDIESVQESIEPVTSIQEAMAPVVPYMDGGSKNTGCPSDDSEGSASSFEVVCSSHK